MAAHAVESESRIRNGKGRIVIVHTLRVPHLGPVPAVRRALTVFDHDGPTVYCFRWLELVPRGGSGILLLHDHGAVGNQLGRVLPQEPLDHGGRVIDFYSRMNTIADAVNKRPGIAEFLVFTPI